MTEEGNPNNQKGIEKVELFHPAALLSNGITLIDTPGIGSTFKHTTKVTHELLPDCDAALFLISADPPMTEVEEEFLKVVLSRLGKVFFVINKIDYLSEPEQKKVASFLLQILHETMGLSDDIELFPVSSKLGLAARGENNAEAWAKSGLKVLEERLVDFACHEKLNALSLINIRRLTEVLDDITFQLDIESRALGLSLAEVENKISVLREKISEVEKEKRVSSDILAGDDRRIRSMVEDRAKEISETLKEDLFEEIRKRLSQIGSMKWNEFASQNESWLSSEIVEVFDNLSKPFINEMKKRLDEIAKTHQERATKLLKTLTEVVARSLDIMIESKEAEVVESFTPDFSWQTVVWSTTMLAPSRKTIERWLPSFLRKSYFEKRLRDDAEALVVHNVEAMRWGALQYADRFFRGLAESTNHRFDQIKAGALGALTDASDRRAVNIGVSRHESEMLAALRAVISVCRQRLSEIRASSLENGSKVAVYSNDGEQNGQKYQGSSGVRNS